MNPHPQELEQWRHTGKTLRYGSVFLLAMVALVQVMPEQLIAPYM